ncbi:MAG: endonuclease/exonuclease/phosphatase family protein [Candidatus Hodarchaeales archaeon]|jgi:endonuclease/exonuclease/phosphatase family metal-dependent hydrolase
MKNTAVIFILLFLFPVLASVNAYTNEPVVDEGMEELSNEPIKILAYNIEESGIDPDWKEVIREENPDIMVLVETGNFDDATNDGFGRSDFTSLITELNSYFPKENPYEAYTAQDIHYDTSGEAVFSRFPVLNFVQLHTLTLDDSSSFVPSHDFIDAEINVTGVIIHVIGVHLKCCGGSTNELKRERAQEGINNYMDSLGSVPIIYLGDLNTFSPEDTGTLAPQGDLGYTIIPMLTDPSNPKGCALHTFFDVYRTLNTVDPGYSYYSSSYRSRIDFIFANSFFTGKFINTTVGDTESASISSDHFSVDAFIQFFPDLTSKNTSTTQTTDITTTITTSVTSQSASLFIFFQVAVIFIIVIRKKQ